MRIGIDARFLAQPATGVHRYLANLLQWLPKVAPEHEYFLYGYAPPPAATAFPFRAIPGPAALFSFSPVLRRAIRRDRLDLFHGTAYVLPWRAPCATVLTLHDLTFEVQPAWSTGPLARWYRGHLRRSAMRADRVIGDSEATRQDILRFYRLPPHKVSTIYLGGAEPAFVQRNPDEARRAIKQHLGLKTPFLLYVGALHERKNVRRLIEAYGLARSLAAIPHALLIVGQAPAARLAALNAQIAALGLTQHVQHLPQVEEALLPLVYAAAEAFIYPSLYEGFGLPTVEAMACGTPVITSRSSSLAEVVGQAGVLVEPSDTLALARAIAAVLTDAGLRADLAARGVQQARQFSWEACVRATAAAYQAAWADWQRARTTP